MRRTCGLTIVALSLIAATSSNAKPRQATPATPIGSPGDWLGTDDYPQTALRNMEQGTTVFSLTVNEAGHVSACVVTSSSGSSDLDEATCERLRLRANFNPATSASGKPVVGTYRNYVRWTIPDDPNGGRNPVVTSPGLLVTSYAIGTDGVMRDCRVEKAEGSLAAYRTMAPTCPTRPAMPLRDSAGNLVAKRFRSTVTVEEVPVK